MQNNSLATVPNMLATNKSRGNIHCFNQKYQLGKIAFRFLVQVIEYFVADFWIKDGVTCTILLAIIAVLAEVGIQKKSKLVW